MVIDIILLWSNPFELFNLIANHIYNGNDTENYQIAQQNYKKVKYSVFCNKGSFVELERIQKASFFENMKSNATFCLTLWPWLWPHERLAPKFSNEKVSANLLKFYRFLLITFSYKLPFRNLYVVSFYD